MKWNKLKKLSVALTLAFALGAPIAPTWQGETAVCEAAKQSASGMQRIAEEWPDDAEVLLETSMGTMRGRQHENIRIFRGIPYAKPPVGELRFAPTEAAEPWDGVLDATRFSLPVTQYGMTKTGEGALTLNVWTPAEEGEKLPVYVFIHGGAFASGSGSMATYESTRLAEQGIVAVTINYRLNAFGFLADETGMEEYGTTGNWGILDQIEALKWIQANIEAFGGDPERVTIGGESAGSFSVSALIVSPLAKGLFRQAIMESGCILNIPAVSPITRGDLKLSIGDSRRYVEMMGGADTPEGIDYMRGIHAEDLAANTRFRVHATTDPQPFCFWPVFDGAVLPKNPMAAVKDGELNAVRLLAGFNTDEGSIFIEQPATEADYHAALYNAFGRNAPDFIARYPIDAKHDAFDRLSEVFGASTTKSGAVAYADALAEMGEDVYFYRFDYRDPNVTDESRIGVAHAAELKYVFGTLDTVAAGHESARAMSDKMLRAWANFIKTGDPNGEDGIDGQTWEKYDPENRRDFRLGEQSAMEPLHGEKLMLEINETLWGGK
ncbi:MAG: carboxylesterase family protein [Schwartzia sp.]|nr:carboxylesterase family protein [Schwartzia sp. (in: firmicutes)]